MKGTPALDDDKLHEECGVFGLVLPQGEERDAAYTVYNALFALQHRGQVAAGITVRRPEGLVLRKGAGLVPEVFSKQALQKLSGASAAIGHVRYSYEGDDSDELRAQPILVHHAAGNMALCYNGRLVNGAQLRAETETRGGIFQLGSDAEIISHIIVREHLRTNTTEDAILNAMHYMIGAYSLVVMDEHKLIAARDPNGYRPLCIGKVGDCWGAASESCAFEALGGHMVRDVEPGEVVVLTENGPESYSCGIRAKGALCAFELIYFARPDSVIDGVSVDLFRREAGACLARRNTVEADIVVGVPDSGLSAAQGFAAESGIPYEMGLMKNRYISRTFLNPHPDERRTAVRLKLNAIASAVRGKRIILVDDSIVQGTTAKRLVQLLRDAGAKEVHLKVSAPPFLHPCYFGTYLPGPDKLAAFGRTNEEICRMIGADSLQFLPVQDLQAVAGALCWGHCDACFTGNYAVPVPRKNEGLC